MKHEGRDPASRDDMTDDHAEKLLAEALEDYHRRRARGERPDEAAYRERLGDLYPLFVELIAAETIIDLALEPAGDETELPLAWGAYTLLREIARGAAGVVYEAIHRKLGRKVALKVLRTGVDTDKVARERFHREAQALAHVKHDNIVEIYEFGEIDGRPFYAMSLVNGPSLKELIKQGNAPEPRELCRGLAGVADALATLHGEGIIHRDVKPQNIMLDADGRYMLADFGLARSSLAETMTQSGDALGTPLYMSPEQILADRKAIDARSDIYGLGATLYEMLTHLPPFKTDNLQALMRMILQERPASPRAVRPDLPKNSAGIALGCLEKKPEDRPQTAEALRDALLAVAEDERVRTPIEPVSRPKRGLRLALDHPILTAAALVLVAVGVWFGVQPPKPTLLSLDATVPSVAQVEDGEAENLPWRDRALAPNRTYRISVTPVDMAYLPKVITIDAQPGEKLRYPELWMEPRKGTDDPVAMDDMRGRFGVESPKADKPPRERGVPEYVAQVQWPRGRVRRQDLTDYEVRLGSKAIRRRDVDHTRSTIEFRIGDESIASVPITPTEDSAARGQVPAEVIARAEPGTIVRWGYRLPGQDDLLDATTFEVVESDPAIDTQLARIRKTLEDNWISNPVQQERGIRLLQTEALLQHDLPYAAWRVLQAPFEAEQRRVERDLEAERDAIDDAVLKEDEARQALADLRAEDLPADAVRRAEHEKAIEAAEQRLQKAIAKVDAFHERRDQLLDAPSMFRSLALLTAQQAVLEKLLPGQKERLDNHWWRRHIQWRDMFSAEAWEAYRSR